MQDVLLFDHIAITRLERSLSRLKNREAAATLEYLASRGVVIDASYTTKPTSGEHSAEQQLLEAATISTGVKVLQHDDRDWQRDELRKIVDGLITLPGIDADRVTDALLETLTTIRGQKDRADGNEQTIERQFQLEAVGATVRLISVSLTNDQTTATPMIPYPRYGHLLLRGTSQETVADLVVKELPVPADDTPWEAILEFRSDPESRRRLFELRHWMSDVSRKVATGQVSEGELEEQLEFLLHEYREHMRLHRMKINTSGLETIVTAAAAVAENLCKFRFEKMAKSLFVFRHRKLDLLEAERAAPGREVAYVVESQDAFGSTHED